MHSPRNMPPSMNIPQTLGQSGMHSPRGLPPSGYHTPRASPSHVIQQATQHSPIYGYQQPLNQVPSLSPRRHYPLNQPPQQHVISNYSPQQQQHRTRPLWQGMEGQHIFPSPLEYRVVSQHITSSSGTTNTSPMRDPNSYPITPRKETVSVTYERQPVYMSPGQAGVTQRLLTPMLGGLEATWPARTQQQLTPRQQFFDNFVALSQSEGVSQPQPSVQCAILLTPRLSRAGSDDSIPPPVRGSGYSGGGVPGLQTHGSPPPVPESREEKLLRKMLQDRGNEIEAQEVLNATGQEDINVIELRHKAELSRVTHEIESLQLVVIDQRDMIAKLRKGLNESDALEAYRKQISDMGNRTIQEHEQAMGQERTQSALLEKRLDVALQISAVGEQEASTGILTREELCKAQAVIADLKVQLALLSSSEEGKVELQEERRLRMEAEEARRELEEKLQRMEREHVAKVAALDAMSAELAREATKVGSEERGAKESAQDSEELRELQKRSVADAKSLRAERDKCMLLEDKLKEAQQEVERQTLFAKDAGVRMRLAERETDGAKRREASKDRELEGVKSRLEKAIDAESLHKLKEARDELTLVKAQHQAEVQELRQQLGQTHDWLEEVLLSSPSVGDQPQPEEQGDARQRVMARLRSTTDPAKFSRLRARIQAHMQATLGMTAEEMGRQVEGLLLAVSAAEAQADQSRCRMEALEEECERLLYTLSRAEELTTGLSSRCEYEEHERLRQMHELVKQQKVISELNIQGSTMQAQMASFEKSAALSLRRQQLEHQQEMDNQIITHRAEVSRLHGTIAMLRSSLELAGGQSPEPKVVAEERDQDTALEYVRTLEHMVEDKVKECATLRAHGLQLEETLLNLNVSYTVLKQDLAAKEEAESLELSRSSGASPYSKSPLPGSDLSVRLSIDGKAATRVAELEAALAPIVTQVAEAKLTNQRLEEEEAILRQDHTSAVGKPWLSPMQRRSPRSPGGQTAANSWTQGAESRGVAPVFVPKIDTRSLSGSESAPPSLMCPQSQTLEKSDKHLTSPRRNVHSPRVVNSAVDDVPVRDEGDVQTPE